MINGRLEKAKERLNAYYEAELAVLSGQEYNIGGRRLRRADLIEIRKAINELENLVNELEAQASGKGSRRAYRVVIRDL